jgi:anti-sigma-K factor RskA
VSECGHDAAPYVLGALEPHEARAFVRHLERCAVCRDEVASLAPVLDALPAAAPPRPVRRALRRRMLRAVRAEPKPRTARPVAATRARSAAAGWLGLSAALLAAVVVGRLGLPHAPERVIRANVGRAELRIDADGHGELIATHLAQLSGGRVYELWLQSGRRVAPSTLFAATAQGHADLGVPADLHGVSRLLVTVEPRGGSPAPTTRAVIQVRLSDVQRS